jgi:hypothetical protein
MLLPLSEFARLDASSDRHEVSLAWNYEYPREALLRIDPAIDLPDRIGPSMRDLVAGHWEADQGLCLMTALWLTARVHYEIDFPRSPFGQVRAKWLARAAAERKAWAGNKGLGAAQYLVLQIEGYSWGSPVQVREVKMMLPTDATAQEEITLFLEARKHSKEATLLQKRGAGSKIRQQKVELKYLTAAQLLKDLAGPKSISSKFIADAMVFSQEELGEPLLHPEAKWLKALKRVDEIVARFQPEIHILRGKLF